ncbi:hypothetical protein AGMMS49975_04680 [Clostridia bacterium]|nr:hypothetical protein AGMMS49975_04680 [Clostridia bacterium]
MSAPDEDELKTLRAENKKLTRNLRRQTEINQQILKNIESSKNLVRMVDKEKARLEGYMDMFLNNSADLVFLFDKYGGLVFVSNSYLTPTGLDILGVSGKRICDLIEDYMDKDEHAAARPILRKAFDDCVEKELDIRLCLYGLGIFRNYMAKITPMFDGNVAKGFIVILGDVTELVLAKNNAMRLSEVKSNFLSRMSHEIRTPMNAIIGLTVIGKETEETAKKEYCLEKIGEASKYLLGIINDILDMSQIESEKFELSVNEFNFEKMMTRVSDVMSFKIVKKNQNLTVHIDDKIPPSIVADEQRLSQVITNLLSNANKFTPENGNITIIAELLADYGNTCLICVKVLDTGIGISESALPLIFANFEQLDSGVSRKYSGTGLGLAISKHIVDMMGGNIRVESVEGDGSSFIFDIVVEKGSAEVFGGGKPDDESIFEDSEGIFEGHEILIVEDIDINREILEGLLEDTGVSMDFAYDGLEAVAKFTDGENPDYELVLMDINMPNLDGYGATMQIREINKDIPIYAMTANVFREDVEKCISAGMNGHLGKPVDVVSLMKTLKTTLLR